MTSPLRKLLRIEPNHALAISLSAMLFHVASAVLLPAATTEYENTTTGTFNDNAGSPLVRTINVSSSASIRDLDVGINLEHTWRGDVEVVLESPSGTRVQIISGASGDSDDHYDFLLDDASGNPIDDGTNNNENAPFYGLDRIAAPSNPLSAFNGENPNGNWRLEFVDLDIGAPSNRIGTFNRAKLRFNDCVDVRVFDDAFWNGVYDPAFDTTAVTGVAMTLTDSLGSSVSPTDNGDGTYTFDVSSLSGAEYLLEVDGSSLPAGYFPGIVAGASSPLTQIIGPGTSPVEIPVQIPKTQCLVADDFDMFTTCFVGGPRDERTPVEFLDENGATQTMIPATAGAVLAFPRPAASSTLSSANRYLATIEEVGATNGLAVQDTLNRVYAGTFAKRHSDYGPGGSGAIYVIDSAGGGVLDTFTIPGAGTTAHAVDATNAANNGTEEGWLRDSDFFGVIGKEGLGDVEINAAQTVLWTINLGNRHLYMVDVADPSAGSYGTVTDLGSIPDPGCPGGSGDWRPYALEFHDGNLYIGGTCTGQANQSIAEMELQVHRVSNPTTPAASVSMTLVYTTRVSPTDGGLAYVRGHSTIEWSPWIDAWDINAFGVPPFASFAHVYPQPWLADIEFDNNHNLILGVRDRFGDQIGINTKSPGTGSSGDSSSDNGVYETVSMGDILQACWDPASSATDVTGAVLGDWTLEGQTGPSGVCGPRSDDPNDSVTAQEFYAATSFGGIHPETAQGALAFHPSFPDEVATIAQDPFALRSGGVSFFSTIDGTSLYQNGNAAGGHQVYGGQNTSSPGQSLLGKANGLGDLEYACGVTGQQIGNRVWLDEDDDGLQDPNEVPIAGVTVYLYVDLDGDGDYDDSTGDSTPDPVTFTTTDSSGAWLFATHPNTGYAVAFDVSTAPAFNDSGGSPVTVADLNPTVYDAEGNTRDTTDSDLRGIVNGLPAIELATGGIGVSSHTFDAGMTTTDLVAIGNVVFDDTSGNGTYDSGEGVDGVTVELWDPVDGVIGNGNDVQVDNPNLAGSQNYVVTTAGGGCYLFENLPVGSYYVRIPPAEFGSGEELYGRHSISGQGGDNTSDDDTDENGDDTEIDGVTSTVIALGNDDEPTGEAGKDAANAVNAADDDNVNLTVDFGFACPAITISPSSLPNGTVGTPYSEMLTSAGGTGPYTYAVTTGVLPAGLSLVGDTITGTPTSETGQTFTIAVTDDAGCAGTRQFTIDPACPAISLSSLPASLPNGTIGTPYPGATILASGGSLPYNFTVQSGSLPAGLALNSGNGALTGTPTGPPGTSNFTVLVTDSYGCPGTGMFSIGIDCNTLAITPDTLSDGQVGQAYGPVNFNAGGATGSVNWSQGGTLPAGMSFSNGVLSGTPAEGGSFAFSVMATDANGCSGTANLSLSIPVASISGTNWEDTDGNGTGDVVIDVVTMALCDSGGSPVDNPNIAGSQPYVITTSVGTYAFVNLVPGSYVVKQTQPAGFATVSDLDSTVDAGGSPPDPPNTDITDNRIAMDVADGETDSGNDFVEEEAVGIGNLVFNDLDGDGIFEPGAGETGIGDVTVEIYASGETPGSDQPAATTTTDSQGCYYVALSPESYFAFIPGAEFGAADDGDGDAGELFGMVSSPGVAGDDETDDDVNENGIDTTDPESTGVRSFDVELEMDDEPTGDGTTGPESGKDGGGDDVIDDDNIDFTIDFGFVASAGRAGVGNLVFNDVHGDGGFQTGLGDAGVDGVIVEVYAAGDTPGTDTPAGTTVTMNGGCYLFTGLANGDYFVHVPASAFGSGAPLSGRVSSAGAAGDVPVDDDADENGLDAADPAATGVSTLVFNLTAGAEPGPAQGENGKDAASDDSAESDYNLTIDLGFTPVANTVAIGNLVFVDGDGNGVFTSGEGVDGVRVELYDQGQTPGVDTPSATTVTSNGGCYLFTGLQPASGFVHIPASQFAVAGPLAGQVSLPGAGGDTGADDNVDENGIDSGDPANRGISSGPIDLALNVEPTAAQGETGKASGADDGPRDGDTNLTVDFGFRSAPVTVGVGNKVFIDSNGDGAYSGSPTDTPAAGALVELYDAGAGPGVGSAIASILTDAQGCYVFTGLPPGTYIVHIPGSQFAFSGPLNGLWSIAGSDGDSGIDDDVSENGIDTGNPALFGISSAPIALAVTNEPQGESGADGSGDAAADGNIDLTVDFGLTQTATTVGIGNLVFIDENEDGNHDAGEGVDGVTVELYASGQSTATPPVASAVTTNGGCYIFTGLTSGSSYFVHIPPTAFQTGAPLHWTFSSPGAGGDTGIDDDADENGVDAADPATTGVSTGDILLEVGNEPVDGGTESGKDFLLADDGLADSNVDLTVDLGFERVKPNSFQNWQAASSLGAETGPLENPDDDLYSNLLEYALCLHPDSGTPDRLTDPDERGGFCAELNGSTSTVDALFIRPLGGLGDLTYVLEAAPALGNPTTWTPVSGITPTITDNLDGTETVRYADLEQIHPNYGFVRLRVDLDDGVFVASDATEVYGWNDHDCEAQCETYSYPYLNKDTFSGAFLASDVGGADNEILDVSASSRPGTEGVAAQLEAGRVYYMEMTGGTYEGHRFEIDEGQTLDRTVFLEVGSARNTLDPIPADLAGSFVLRAHTTLDDVAPPTVFAGMNSALLGDRALIFSGGAWSTYWVYDQSGTIPKQWTDSGNSSLADVGGTTIIEPCQGFFLHPRNGALTLTSVGMVRSNDLACPLSPGHTLVGSGFPTDQTPSDRAMLRGLTDNVVQDYFSGSASSLQSDQLLFWLGDATTGVEGYHTYYRVLIPSTIYDHWTDQTNSNLDNVDENLLFERQHGVFVDSINGQDRAVPSEVWVWPVRWAP